MEAKCLGYSIQDKGLRGIGKGDQADRYLHLIQNSQNTSVHLKVDEEL